MCMKWYRVPFLKAENNFNVLLHIYFLKLFTEYNDSVTMCTFAFQSGCQCLKKKERKKEHVPCKPYL